MSSNKYIKKIVQAIKQDPLFNEELENIKQDLKKAYNEFKSYLFRDIIVLHKRVYKLNSSRWKR